MKINSIGGGPAGLYFALLMKRADPSSDIAVYERNRADDTFGFGVVFSDATLDHLADADRESFDAITRSFVHWDDIDIHHGGTVTTSTGHGFSGLSRQRLLDILQKRCRDVGVHLLFEHDLVDPPASLLDADLVVAADGVNSGLRARYATEFSPNIDWRPNRFVWLGTTVPFRAFTFYFKENEHGLWRVHAYRYDREHSTFIVECTEETWRRAGFDGPSVSEDDTLAYMERVFAKELDGHRLLKNRSTWRSFPTITNARWHHDNIVLMGDAAHTAHFSIGSGTKLAMEDAIALAQALDRRKGEPLAQALAIYEEQRRPVVESTQRAAQVSLEWFETTERYMHLEPLQFAFSLLTRSLRITHENLKVRDPGLVNAVDRWFMGRENGNPGLGGPPVPPMFTTFRLRDMVLENRVVVSPMCQYSAEDGTVGDWHLVHLGSRAIGGAGLVITEMTDVSREGRITPGCAGMYKDEHIVAWKRIVDFVHQTSGAKIALQLAHAGRKGSTRRMWEGIDEPLADGNWPLISASALPYMPHSQVPRAMDRRDMVRVTADFVRATQMAVRSGFDMIELHFAHGYLLASFLSPLTNVRSDEYGGTISNRMRFPLEVFDAVRAAWPATRPISVRISATDWREGGIDAADVDTIARVLKAHGLDILDVSAGQTVVDGAPRYGRLFQTPFSDRIRQEVGIATMTVGNISSYSDVNSILASGRADLCAVARAHLYDPYWTHHAAKAQGHDAPWPDPYVTMNRYAPRP